MGALLTNPWNPIDGDRALNEEESLKNPDILILRTYFGPCFLYGFTRRGSCGWVNRKGVQNCVTRKLQTQSSSHRLAVMHIGNLP